MPRLLAAGRQREILRHAEAAGTVSVEALATALAVSRETIRRDLKALASRGLVAVVHGGAVRRDLAEAPYAARRTENRVGKERIAALAVSLVRSGMSLLLDSGTTTHALAFLLARSGLSRLVIHTTSLSHAQVLGAMPNARIHLIGGELDPNDHATMGPEVMRSVANLRVDLAFVSVGGIDPDGRIVDYARAAADQRSAMLACATAGYLLADHGKFGRSLPGLLSTGEGTGLLVDEPPPRPLRARLKASGIELAVAPAS